MLWHCSIFKTAVGNVEIHELIIMWRSFVCVLAFTCLYVYNQPLLAHYWALCLLATETQSPLMEVQLNGSVKWFASLKLPCYTDTNFPFCIFIGCPPGCVYAVTRGNRCGATKALARDWRSHRSSWFSSSRAYTTPCEFPHTSAQLHCFNSIFFFFCNATAPRFTCQKWLVFTVSSSICQCNMLVFVCVCVGVMGKWNWDRKHWMMFCIEPS